VGGTVRECAKEGMKLSSGTGERTAGMVKKKMNRTNDCGYGEEKYSCKTASEVSKRGKATAVGGGGGNRKASVDAKVL